MSTQELVGTLPERPIDHPADPTAGPPDRDDAATYQLVDALGRLGRLMGRLKAEFAARHPGSPADYGAMSLLVALVEGGPRRAGTLAEAVLMDPSQVSRRIAMLVRAGLVERRADSADGRAIVLAPTSSGRAMCTSMMCARAAYLRTVVDDWPAPELEGFIADLDRFAGTLERVVADSGGRFGPGADWSPPSADPGAHRQGADQQGAHRPGERG